MSGIGDLLRDYLNEAEEAMDPVRAKKRKYQRETEDQPGRALQRESTPERGYIPRSATGHIDEEGLAREQYKFNRKQEEQEKVGDKFRKMRERSKLKPKTPGEQDYHDEKSAASAARNAAKAEIIGTRG